MSIAHELDALARKLAGRLQQEDTPLDRQIDGFKALTLYHVALLKAKKRRAGDDDYDDEETDTTMEGIRERIRAVK
jgi:hypothetical protein